jgi:hypothetical protein
MMRSDSKISGLRYILVMAGVLAVTSAIAQVGKFEVFLQPINDGCLADTSQVWNNEADQVDDSSKVAYIGSNFGSEKAAVLEFPLPPKSSRSFTSVRSANLVLSFHEKGIVPISVEVFAYHDEGADGAVNLSDWGRGESIGKILIADKTEIDMRNRAPHFDVTAAVQKALAADARYIGFFLRAVDATQEKSGSVRMRPTEFGADTNMYHPKLELLLE